MDAAVDVEGVIIMRETQFGRKCVGNCAEMGCWLLYRHLGACRQQRNLLPAGIIKPQRLNDTTGARFCRGLVSANEGPSGGYHQKNGGSFSTSQWRTRSR